MTNLRWSVHVAEILKKANGRSYMLKLLKRFNLPHDDLVTIFTDFVRSLAEYAADAGIVVSRSMNLSPWQASRTERARSSWAGITHLTMKPFKNVAWILWVTEVINLVWISSSLSWSLSSLVVGPHPREVECTVEIWGTLTDLAFLGLTPPAAERALYCTWLICGTRLN